jgi:hypothetical protein
MPTDQVASTYTDPSGRRVDGGGPVNLPDESNVGQVAIWLLPSSDNTLHVNARFLGVGTSWSEQHRHPIDRPAYQDERCRACRWFEPRIFREVDGQRRYLVHRTGQSIVPGEVSFTSHEWVHGPYEVIEVLTTRRNGVAARQPYLTHPAARVLAQAASYDDDLNDAYVNRAVA